MTGWQPIETAPRDGSWFLAFQDGEIYPCAWEIEDGSEGWYDYFNHSFEAPTHYHALPEAPTTQQRGMTA